MKICLANPACRKYLSDDIEKGEFYLESFTTYKDWLTPVLRKSPLFLIDSGAFYFMTHDNQSADALDGYTDEYIRFINEYDIKYFFEMDVDVLVGYEKVLEFRKRIEDGTGKKVIPVWHKSRGKEAFFQMCDQYDYVAIGGIASGEIKPPEYKYFHWFINTAHDYGCKIHGLGFTSLNGLYEYRFDSVDSTTWCQGARHRVMYRFNGRRMEQYLMIGDEHMTLDLRHDINRNNLREWIEFQKYADTHL